MKEYLNEIQAAHFHDFSELFSSKLGSKASLWESTGVDDETIDFLADQGILGGYAPIEYGGADWDALTYGLLNLCAGEISPSLTGLFNVHFMVIQAIQRWGNESQKAYWIPRLISGEKIGAFAITEPGVGSDIQSLSTWFSEINGELRLNGSKKWITFGSRADVYLVFGKQDGKGAAYLVERGTPGLSIQPIRDMLGFRGAHLAGLEFNNCPIEKDNLIGSVGIGLDIIASYALLYGRLSVAFASLGMLKRALHEASRYVFQRETFGVKLIDQPIIQEMMAELAMGYESARNFCFKAAHAIQENQPGKMEAVMTAKYFTSKAAGKLIPDAIQVMGAWGCNENNLLPRLYRDAKIMEVVEGSNPVLIQFLGKYYSSKSKRQKTYDNNKHNIVASYDPA